MKYGPSEEYTRHVDFYNRDERFFGNDIEKFGGQRIKTALLYLTSATGGETVFPKALKPNAVGEASCAGKCAPCGAPLHRRCHVGVMPIDWADVPSGRYRCHARAHEHVLLRLHRHRCSAQRRRSAC